MHHFRGVPLSEGRLRAIVTDERAMLFLAAHLGIPPVPLGTAFRCVMREEMHPSAALFRDRSGVLAYHDFHMQGTPLEWLTLAEVYAAQTTRIPQKLDAPSHATWLIRLLVDAGLLDPALVAMRPLPPGASRTLRKVYAGIRLLFGVKWLYSPGDPSALSWRFLAGWCGVAQGTADRELKMLVSEGIVKPVGQHRAAYGRTMTTYLPVVPPQPHATLD